MNNSNPTETMAKYGKERKCWTCREGTDEKKFGRWRNPCMCRGSRKWIHQNCLERVVENHTQCPGCGDVYIIMYVPGDKGRLHRMLTSLEDMIDDNIPLLLMILLIAVLYGTAVLLGGFTILQMIGREKGFALMKSYNLLFSAFVLPAIPIGLILGRVICWQQIIHLIRHRGRINMRDVITNRIFDMFQAPRILAGALLLPTFATLVGQVLLLPVENDLIRSGFGGLAFLVIKRITKIYWIKVQYGRQKRRFIMDSNEAQAAVQTQDTQNL